MATPKAQLRPLLARPGAAFECHGDGLCCTDIHFLGPLTRSEARRLKLISPESVIRTEDVDGPVLATRADGGCLFLGEGHCELHATHGAAAKPEGCRHFPFGLTATPTGGRVTTEHRCPCRTMGRRKTLVAESAAPFLTNNAGRLSADYRVRRVSLNRRKAVRFADWLAIEAELLTGLEGRKPEAVLHSAPFPKLCKLTWKEVFTEMIEEADDGTRFGAALASFGHTVRSLCDQKRPPHIDRRWASAFDRAERRATEVRPAREIYADWIADEIWALEWLDRGGTLRRARAALSTQLAVARDIARRLVEDRVRSDRAAAEAVTIVTTVGASAWWRDVLKAFPR